jgi:hypothetical protein
VELKVSVLTTQPFWLSQCTFLSLMFFALINPSTDTTPTTPVLIVLKCIEACQIAIIGQIQSMLNVV